MFRGVWVGDDLGMNRAKSRQLVTCQKLEGI